VILVDRELRRRQAEGRPVTFAMVGAGFQGRGIANNAINSTPGLHLAAIANRNLETARRAYVEAGVDEVTVVEDVGDLEDVVARGGRAITDDPMLVCRAEGIEAVVEVTGTVEYAARAVLEAINHGKHAIVMNAEVDGTLGPILKVYADRAGVVYTASDGDQPGVQGNLYRFVRGLGVTPLVMGNNKGLQDPYRNPTTQEAFARKWGQNPHMVTSFADGTKMAFEQTTVANAFNLSILERGMTGMEHKGHFDELTQRYDVEQLKRLGGIVDYTVGASPSPGVYCLGAHDDPKQRHYLNLYKLGEGPLYSFYVPYHLCHFETPFTVARAVLYADHALTPAGASKLEVLTTAKIDLRAGQVIDQLGGYMTYGQAETADVFDAEGLLPIGVAEGCRLKREVARDGVLTYADVDLPPGRLHDELRDEQARHFGRGGAPVGRAA
jgi:predicted homoserine dehydrogenase-like protein